MNVMETPTFNIVAEVENFWPKLGEIYTYCFITETTNLLMVNKNWQKI